jgi:hypothetical protein
MLVLAKFCRRPSLDRRLLLSAAALHVFVVIGVRVLSFARLRHGLDRLAAFGSRTRRVDDIETRVVRAVRTVAARLPGASCLTEALATRCLLMQFRREATLCFGVSRIRPAGRPFDAHAWLEHGGSGLIGARAIVYDPLRRPSRCVSSPSAR